MSSATGRARAWEKHLQGGHGESRAYRLVQSIVGLVT